MVLGIDFPSGDVFRFTSIGIFFDVAPKQRGLLCRVQSQSILPCGHPANQRLGLGCMSVLLGQLGMRSDKLAAIFQTNYVKVGSLLTYS